MVSAASVQPWTVLSGHQADVQALAFLDPQHLFSGDSDGFVWVWDLTTRRPVQEASLQTAQQGVLSLQVTASPSGTPVLFSAGRDGSVQGYAVRDSGLDDRQPVFSLPTRHYTFCRPHILPEPSHIQHRTEQPANPPPSATPHNSQGWLLACPGESPGEVHVWDMRQAATTQPAILLPPPTLPKDAARNRQLTDTGGTGQAATAGQTTALCFTGTHVQSQPQLVVGYEAGCVALWDLRAPTGPARLSVHAHTEPVLCCAASPTGQQAVTGSADSTLNIWDVEGTGMSGSDWEASVTHTLPTAGVSHAAWRADGLVLATGGWDGKMRIFSGRKGHKPLAVLRHHTKDVPAVAWAPGPDTAGPTQNPAPDVPAGLLATGSRDSSVALWNVYAWRGSM